MTFKHRLNRHVRGHRVASIAVLCLFAFTVAMSRVPVRKVSPKKMDEKVYLIHSDNLRYDMYGANPMAQIVKGHVSFSHKGGYLWCDSAYFYQNSNSVKAFGHVRFKQGDTLSLTCDRAFYDGQIQMLQARQNVVLKHLAQTLYTDSLDFDRLYDTAYFKEGGRLVDGKDRLVADWGEYNTKTRAAVFYYNVKLHTGSRLVTTDTLYYDAAESMAHVVGPSQITSGTNIINTTQGYFNTKTDSTQLYGRSTITDKEKTITGDTLLHNDKTGISHGYGNVVYIDNKNKHSLNCDELYYNDKTGYGYADRNLLGKEFSQGDTLYAHADTFKIYTFNINTDSMYRKVHAYHKVRAYRTDLQAVCDSLVFNTLDSCMTMYKDPIVWNTNRQVLGEVIKVYMNDSTIRYADVAGQALSVEMMPDSVHYNQIASKEMMAYFVDGNVRRTDAVGNVTSIYYPVDSKDSSITALNYMETDTMRMHISPQRQLQRIWASKSTGTAYPMTQVPPGKDKLTNFHWFDYIRPMDKNDIFEWRGKNSGATLKAQKRLEPPLQKLTSNVAETSPPARESMPDKQKTEKNE